MAEFLLTGFADEAAPDLLGQIAALKRNNMGFIEVRNIDGKCVIDYTEDEICNFAKTLADNDIKVSSLGSPIGKYNVTDDFAPHFERFKKAVKTAQILGTNKMRMFSFFIPDNEDCHKYTDEVLSRMNQMLDYAEEHGILLCHENEARIYGRLPSECEELQQKLPKLHAIFDPCNYIMENVDIPSAIDKIAPFVEYLHIKDGLYEDHAIVPAGCGDGHISDVLAKVADVRADKTTFVSVEPHLFIFTGYGNLDQRKLKHHFSFANNNESFDAAVNALKDILKNLGYKEGEDKKWKK